jgi:hypothetical protein
MKTYKITDSEYSSIWNFVTDVAIQGVNNELTDKEMKQKIGKFKKKLKSLVDSKIFQHTCSTDPIY